MRQPRFHLGAPIVGALIISVWMSTGFLSAQEATVRINGAIDKLARGKSLAGAIMYDFSLYAAAQFASSDLDFIIIDMEHRGLDFERLETFLLGTTNKAEIAKQGNLQVRVPPHRSHSDLRPCAERGHRQTSARHGRVRDHVPGDRKQSAGARRCCGIALSAVERLEVSEPGRPPRQRQHAGRLVLGIVET